MPDPTTPAPSTTASPAATTTPATTTPATTVATAAATTATTTTPATTAATTTETPASPSWPDNWRQLYAGEDAKKLARLERFTDPAKAFDALVEAQNKIRSGEFAKPLTKDARPEEVSEWRAANGVPDKPEGYFAKLPNGLVIGADDKPMFDEVAAKLHARNVQPEVIHDLAEWYYGMQDAQTTHVAEADKTQAKEAIDALRQEWGADYRGNLDQVSSFLDGMGKDLKAQFMDATLPDGRRLFNSPDVIKWLATQARELNPAGVITPGGGESQMSTIDGELGNLTKMMGNPNSDYWKGPNADRNQKRFLQLTEAKQKLGKRES